MGTQMEPISVEIDVYMYVIVSEADMFEANARDSRSNQKTDKIWRKERTGACSLVNSNGDLVVSDFSTTSPWILLLFR